MAQTYEVRTLNELSSGSSHLVHRSVSDDGSGAVGAAGTVDYGTGAVVAPIVHDYVEATYNADGSWTSDTHSEAWGGALTATYALAGAATVPQSQTLTLPPLTIQLLPGLTDRIVPGTVRFRLGTIRYSDRDGQGTLYWDDGTVAGSIDYTKRLATITDHSASTSSAVVIESMLSTYGDWLAYEFAYRTAGAPLQPGGMLVNATDANGGFLSVNADLSGGLSQPGVAEGHVEFETGSAAIKFGELVADSSLTPAEKTESWYDPADVDGSGNIWRPNFVFPNTVKYSAVVYSILPLDADLLGLDPVRLPADGRVPIFRPADILVVHQQDTLTLPSAPAAGSTHNLPVDQVAEIILRDQDDALVDTAQYETDLPAGTITFATPLDISAYNQPLVAHYRIEDMSLVTDVQIDGQVTVNRAQYHIYDPARAYVSSALRHGDLQARYSNLFAQKTWTNEWSAELIGDAPIAQFNDSQYPIAVANEGAIRERWAIVFQSTTAFLIFGETVGVVGGGTTTADATPPNPESGTGYFTIPAGGWGAGWSAGNVVRFDTYAAAAPIWTVRTVVSGDPTTQADSFTIQNRGDAD